MPGFAKWRKSATPFGTGWRISLIYFYMNGLHNETRNTSASYILSYPAQQDVSVHGLNYCQSNLVMFFEYVTWGENEGSISWSENRNPLYC